MDPHPWAPGNPERPSHAYVFLRFLRYGLLAWGGPVAQIGLMHREVVARDRWISEERFRKLFGLYQALPGPEALELAVYFGLLKRGRLAGLLAGLGFAVPGILLVAALAALYAEYGLAHDWVQGVLYGMKAAVIGLIAVAVLRLGRSVVVSWDLGVIALATLALSLLVPRLDFVALLGLAGAASLLAAFAAGRTALVLPPLLAAAFALPGFWPPFAWLFAKAGLLTFGGAYTIVPILHEDAVEAHGWISEEQLVDALALSALVPSPFIAVGTFVGYLVAGPLGAAVATVLIFAPAFLLTLFLHRWFERVLASQRAHHFLLGVAAGVIGLVVAATVPLGRAAIVDVPTAVIAALAAALLVRMRGIPLVLGGAGLAGVLLRLP